MPCWTVTRIQVQADLSKFNAARLTEALTLDGASASLRGDMIRFSGHPELLSGWINMITGTVQANQGMGQTQVQNALARSYSRQIVRAQSKRFGWTVKEQGGNKFTVSKRF